MINYEDLGVEISYGRRYATWTHRSGVQFSAVVNVLDYFDLRNHVNEVGDVENVDDNLYDVQDILERTLNEILSCYDVVRITLGELLDTSRWNECPFFLKDPNECCEGWEQPLFKVASDDWNDGDDGNLRVREWNCHWIYSDIDLTEYIYIIKEK